jgi:hypothetical protein
MTSPASSLDARFVPQTDVHAQVLFGEAVLLDVTSGTYFGLNAVGTRIWELLVQERPLRAVLAALGEEFDVEPETLGRDVAAFIDALELRGLVRRRDERTEHPSLDMVGA